MPNTLKDQELVFFVLNSIHRIGIVVLSTSQGINTSGLRHFSTVSLEI